VLLAALRQPLVLARQLATLAAFAGGRLRIGIGVGGEYPAEFTAAGVSIAERGSLTAAAVTELRTELALDPGLAGMRSLGAHLPGRANPVPPFFFAGAQQVALRRAAELGDGWIGYSHSPEGFARRRSLVLRHRAARGLEPAGFVTGMVLPVHLGARTDSARNITAQRLISGSASEVLDALGRYWQAGCTEMVLQLGDDGPGYQEQLDAVSSVVLPALRAL
jgi:alkanesulfonate monooxygenase SsuD/methylene tetrahydromethanopterin reductase-like flavin-dependent oxidoreductase (luciferase family)